MRMNLDLIRHLLLSLEGEPEYVDKQKARAAKAD